MAHAIQGFPRHLSIHVGGFVLSAEPLDEVAPIEPATMPDRTIIPWDKDDLDTLGFFKVDVLGLGMLTAIRKALARSSQRPTRASRGADGDRPARAHPRGGPRVYEALCQRRHGGRLPDREPRADGDAAAPAAADVLRSRRRGRDRAPGPHPGGDGPPVPAPAQRARRPSDPPHPKPRADPRPHARRAALPGAGDADRDRRRGVHRRRGRPAAARHGGVEAERQARTPPRAPPSQGFVERGITREFAERLYEQIQGFGEYGFPESHAASFALLVYASAWLKVHHPAAFAAALLNSQPMGFYSPSTILSDAQRHGVVVLPVRVTASDWDCTLVPEARGEDRAPGGDPRGAAPGEAGWARRRASASRRREARGRSRASRT